MQIVGRRVADADGKVNSLVDGLHRNTFDSYVSFQHSVDQTLLALGSHLREVFDREPKELQRGVHAALRHGAGGSEIHLLVLLKLWTEA